MDDRIESLELGRRDVAYVGGQALDGRDVQAEVAPSIEAGVEPGDVVAGLCEVGREDRPDVAVVTCDKNLHRSPPSHRSRQEPIHKADEPPTIVLKLMPIDWKTVPEPREVGDELLAFMRELFPIPRSLTGDGVRETLAVLAREYRSRSSRRPRARRCSTGRFRASGTSAAPGSRGLTRHGSSTRPTRPYTFSATASRRCRRRPRGAPRSRLHPRDDPDLIPYRTSYWTEQWGFCMSRRQLESLEHGKYRVVVDSTLEDGSLT